MSATLTTNFIFYWNNFWRWANEHKIHTNENQVTTIYKQAERFAEITKSAIVSGNIVRAKKCLALPNDYLLLELRNQKRHF
jgi:hypothetical protein